MTAGKLYWLNLEVLRHVPRVITRIERLPLVVPPIVNLRVEGPALLLPEATPSGRAFLEEAEMGREPLPYTHKDHKFTELTVQINSC